MAEYSGAREQRTSGELTSATTRRKKSSNLVAPPSSSSKRTRAASTVESTALPSGFGEARRGYREQPRRTFLSARPRAHGLPRGAPDASPVPLYLPALQNAPGAVQTRACCKPESFGKRPPCRCQSGSALLTLIGLCSWNEAPCAKSHLEFDYTIQLIRSAYIQSWRARRAF